MRFHDCFHDDEDLVCFQDGWMLESDQEGLKNMHKIYYNRMLKEKAQELRREMTEQERKLWYLYLKRHAVQFRRQKQFGRYIADFFAAAPSW